MKKNKQMQKGWTQLNLKYREWEDMRAKGKLKMKKKLNKDGKEYYDFDFTRYHYYYSYPEDHIGLASPAIQKEFINYVLDKSTQNFSQLYLDQQPSSWGTLQNILKPLELHEFLRDMSQQLTQKMSTLRIQKTLRLKKLKGLFGPQNQLQKSTIELIESQIRSLLHKQIRLSNKYNEMGTPLQQRLKNRQSYLKTRNIDQFQFAQLNKGDFVVFMRIRLIKQVLGFNCQLFGRIVQILFQRNYCDIRNRVLEARGKMTYAKRKQGETQRAKLIQKLIDKINQLEPNHFDNAANKQRFQSLIQSLDYLQNLQQSTQQNRKQKMFSPYFSTLELSYQQPIYLAMTTPELKTRLFTKLAHYFNPSLLSAQKQASTQHICYKINNLCFLQLKVLWQSYNYAYMKEESALIKIRSMMRKQLQLVFSQHVNELLNIRNHSMKVVGDERWIQDLLSCKVEVVEKEATMEVQMKRSARFRDPLIISFLELLGVNRDLVVREQIQKYVTKSMEASKNLYKHRSLYYKNSSCDEKVHLINILNHNIAIRKSQIDPTTQLYFKLLQQPTNASQQTNKTENQQEQMDPDLLRSYYMLIFLRCSEIRYQLLEILNAQLMCMIKVQSRIKMLWAKGKIPFQMSKEFIDRFTDPSDNTQLGFTFLNNGAAQTHVDQILKQMTNEDAERDFIQWNAEIGIQVRRRKSDNPLLQGKSVLYIQSAERLQQSLQRIQFLCSEAIKRRQTFLPSTQLTLIIDRLEILFESLTLQQKFQQSKLKLLSLYNEQILCTVNAQGIKIMYEQMNKIIHYNNIVDLTQPHFVQCYNSQIQSFEAKAKILRMLIRKQNNFEKEFCKKSFNQFIMASFGNSLPELSSIYYTEEIAAQQNFIIQQDGEDLNESASQDTESQHMVGKNTISEISSVMQAHSHYHLKTTFQEVLSKNSVEGIKEGNNKKQEIMNKKKQKIINDSVLGAMIPRKAGGGKQNQQLYTYSYFVAYLMRKIDDILRNHCLYPGNLIKSLFLQELVQAVQIFIFVEHRPLIKPEEMSLSLNAAHKSLNKFVEKAKAQGNISSRSSNDHWLCINSKIMQNLITGQTGSEVDQMRGLYIILNTFHINEIHYRSTLNQNIEISPYSHYQYLQKLLTEHCSQQIDQKQFQLQNYNYFEKRQLCLYKLYGLIKESGELTYLPVGNYIDYYKAMAAFDFAVFGYLQAVCQAFAGILNGYWKLEGQLNVMEKYQCCYEHYPVLAKVPGLENRVYLRKKLDSLMGGKKLAIDKSIILQIVQNLNHCTTQIPKFRKVEAKMSLNSLANLAYEFEKYIFQIQKSSILINYISEQLRSQVKASDQVQNLLQTSALLPLIDKNLLITKLSNAAIFHVFHEHRHLIEQPIGKVKKQVKLRVSQEKVSFKKSLDYISMVAELSTHWLKEWTTRRKKAELNPDSKKFQFLKHLDRHFSISYNQTKSTLQCKLKSSLKQTSRYQSYTRLRQWMEVQLLLFGCGLSEQQLLKYRKMLCNSSIVFPIFWQDNSKHVISNKQLSRLKNSSLDANTVVNNYKNQYLSYLHLKKIYRNFVQDLAEYQFDQEPQDTFLVLYSGAPNYFNHKQQDWSFLTLFCDSFVYQPKSSVDQMCDYIRTSTKYLGHSESRFFLFENSKTNYNLDQIKYELWNSKNKSNVRRVDSARRNIKLRLTQSKSLAVREITDEVGLVFYRAQRLQQLLDYLGIDKSEYKREIQDFKQNFDKYVHEGIVLLTPKQTFISNMTEKSIQAKAQLIKCKQQIMRIITSNQFYLKLIRQKFYLFCTQILDNELSLRRILQQDLYNEEVSRDQRILKQTINKILVPKVKLNPFLCSPLKVDNYFFAGTIKMSFIDQFLNKLRNRAVLIQLAEGGTGYLLKVNQLDQSVQVLCKSILGFSQKQFADRFRTVYEALEQAKQRNTKLSEQNKNLKAILNSLKGYQSKQIKSLLYEKLNDYLVTFYEHDKNYQILMNLLKSVQNKIENELNTKFADKIKKLEFENSQLKSQLMKLNEQNSHIIKSCSNEVRDILYQGFKKKAQTILNKEFITDLDESQRFQQLEQQDSHILLKKLKMQKSFYQLKISKIESICSQKIKNLQKKILQQSKLQNLLTMQQEKNRGLTAQVKQLQKCSIENELLKKQMNKKEQEQTMQKFRLVKVNESLKGKLKRMQDEGQIEKANLTSKIETLTKIEQKSKASYSVQVSPSDQGKIKRKSFHIKTESNTGTRMFDLNIWKEKWLKSERKLQEAMESLRKAYQHFIFTKNYQKLSQNMKAILGNYQSRKVDTRLQQLGTQI